MKLPVVSGKTGCKMSLSPWQLFVSLSLFSESQSPPVWDLAQSQPKKAEWRSSRTVGLRGGRAHL